MRKQIYKILAVSEKDGDLSWWFDTLIITLIAANVLSIILESIDSIQMAYSDFFIQFELISVIIFSIEYILRVWTANEDPKYQTPVLGNMRYMLSPMAVIDFLAIMPFYLPLFGFDLRFLRIMRLFRLFRLFKIVRYIRAIRIMRNVVQAKKEELLVSFVFTFFMLLMTSSLMYYIENEAQPEQFSSIPQTMWWGIATLTTVGYGDIYPITPLGKIFGGAISILGIGLFALPTGILASGFSDELNKSKTESRYCSQCGAPYH